MYGANEWRKSICLLIDCPKTLMKVIANEPAQTYSWLSNFMLNSFINVPWHFWNCILFRLNEYPIAVNEQQSVVILAKTMLMWKGLCCFRKAPLYNPSTSRLAHAIPPKPALILEPVAKAINSTGKMASLGWTSNSNLDTSETSGIQKPTQLGKKMKLVRSMKQVKVGTKDMIVFSFTQLVD